MKCLFASCGSLPLSAFLLFHKLVLRHKPAPKRFEFGAIGDQHYGAAGIAKWPALQSSINRSTALQFVVHTGDIKSGSTLCDNPMFANRRQAFDAFEMPLILTPGDNEWTDCHRENNGSYDSLERLDFLRRTFYPDNQSMGKRKIMLSQQREVCHYFKYVENEMWSQGNMQRTTSSGAKERTRTSTGSRPSSAWPATIILPESYS